MNGMNFGVSLSGESAEFVLSMAKNNGIDFRKYTEALIEKGIEAEKKEAARQQGLTVKRWLRTGELGEHLKSQADIIEECGRHLDGSCAHEILGEAIFEATNGKYYVITTEALIDECNPEYLKSVLAELEEETEEENE